MRFNGERVVEGDTPQNIWVDHVARYEFAAKYVEGKVVLDIACGTGYGCRILRQHSASKVFGVDISSESINFSRNKYTDGGVEFRTGDILNIDFPDSYFDVVVCLETIEHVENQGQALSEILRVLKTGGLLIISSPNRKLTTPGKSIENRPRNPYHVIEYSTNEFISVLKNYFRTLEIRGQRGRNKLLLSSIAERFLKPRFPSLYDPAGGGVGLERLSPMKEYRYITAVCIKPQEEINK